MNAIFFEWTMVLFVFFTFAVIGDRIDWLRRRVKARRAVERRLGL